MKETQIIFIITPPNPQNKDNVVNHVEIGGENVSQKIP